jgi:hypothetical protein
MECSTIMQAPAISIFPIESRPYGLTYGEWSAKWWQWLLSIPRSESPAFDKTGDKATLNQHDPNVFFLCQTIDGIKRIDKTTAHRKVTLNYGRSILMPIINWVSVLHVDGETDEELVSVAKKRMDAVSTLELTIDGINVEKGFLRYRAVSPFFDVVLSYDNIFELPAGPRHFVSDGYWIFFRLENNAKLSTFGSCSSGVNKFGISYDIALL